MVKRPPRHKVNRKQRAKAIAALSKIVDSNAQPYVVAKAAAAIIGAAKIDDDDAPERDPDAPGTIIFMPRKNKHVGQREDESHFEWSDRIRARVEGRRAAYCASLGEPYDPMRPLPYSPWPVPGSDPELEAEAARMVDAAEAAEVERQRAHPRPAPVEVLGPREDSPGYIIYDFATPEGRADYRRWRAEAEAAGHKVLAPQ